MLIIRETGETLAWVWGKTHCKRTVGKLQRQLQKLEITWDSLAFDDWLPFRMVFIEETCEVGKEYTEGIEENNYRIRHRARRAFRKTDNFSKKCRNHIIALGRVFYDINFGFV